MDFDDQVIIGNNPRIARRLELRRRFVESMSADDDQSHQERLFSRFLEPEPDFFAQYKPAELNRE